MTTLHYIHGMVRSSREDPFVREVALDIIRKANVREKDRRGIALAIHAWVQRHIQYVNDPTDVEFLILPSVMLRKILAQGHGSGDCDDMVLTEAGLLQSLGINTRSVIIKADKRDPRQWSHIYLEADVGGWMPLDPIMKDKPPGWAPPKYYAKKVIPVGDGFKFPPKNGRIPLGMTAEPAFGGYGMNNWDAVPAVTNGGNAWAREVGNPVASGLGSYGMLSPAQQSGLVPSTPGWRNLAKQQRMPAPAMRSAVLGGYATLPARVQGGVVAPGKSWIQLHQQQVLPLAAQKAAVFDDYVQLSGILSHDYAQQMATPGFAPRPGEVPIENSNGYWPALAGSCGGTIGAYGTTTSETIANLITGVGSGAARIIAPGAVSGGQQGATAPSVVPVWAYGLGVAALAAGIFFLTGRKKR